MEKLDQNIFKQNSNPQAKIKGQFRVPDNWAEILLKKLDELAKQQRSMAKEEN